MAINKENVALDIASRLVSTSSDLMNAVEEFTDLLDWATDAGINMANHNTAFESSPELQHVDGATLNKLATIIPALVSHLDTNLVTGVSSGAWLQQIRRS